jgi:hypothetical protein
MNSLYNIKTFKLLVSAGDNTVDITKEKDADFTKVINGK